MRDLSAAHGAQEAVGGPRATTPASPQRPRRWDSDRHQLWWEGADGPPLAGFLM